jgi:hypothetical protein
MDNSLFLSVATPDRQMSAFSSARSKFDSSTFATLYDAHTGTRSRHDPDPGASLLSADWVWVPGSLEILSMLLPNVEMFS